MAQDNFLGETRQNGFLTEEIFAPEPVRGQLANRRRAQEFEPTGLTEEELAGTKTANEAHGTITTRPLAPAGSVDLFTAAIHRGDSLEEVEGAVQKQEEIKKALLGVEEFTNIDLAMANDPRVGGQLFRIERRAQAARERLLNMAEEAEDGFAGKVLEFIDQTAYDTFVSIGNVASELGGEGTQVSRLADEWTNALRTMDDEEFEAFAERRFGDISREALTGETDQFRMVRELQALDAAGAVLWDEDMGRISGLLAATDIASFALGGAGVGWRAGRSSLGRLRSSTGTRGSTSAAQDLDLVRNPEGRLLTPTETNLRSSTSITPPQMVNGRVPLAPDVELMLNRNVRLRRQRQKSAQDSMLDADSLDDMMPSAFSTRVRGPQVKPAPPVSAGRVSQSVVKNMFVRRFLERQNKMAFGTLDLTTPARTWAEQHAAKLADSSGTNLIDLDIVGEDIQQVRAAMTFGKPDGMPFKEFDTAKKMSAQAPNSRVVDTRTGKTVTEPTKNGEYAVVVETRVPTRELTNALDTSEVANKSIIGRLFGRADRNSSSFDANLGDAADYGGLGFLNDFKEIRKDLRKLGKKESGRIDAILTTLRDTPNGGNARTWLTSADFSKAYHQLTGEYPSRKVIQAYEDLVQMSDFSWYVKANERLSSLANQGATVVKTGDVETLAFPTQRTVGGLKGESETVWVWDAANQRRVSVKKLDDKAQIMALPHRAKDGSTYITNFTGNTRLPTLEDAFPYNAGGPRSNPDVTWFVGNNEGSWSTLIGARSQKDADRAVVQYNTIASRISRSVADGDVDISQFNRGERAEIDALIRANNDWNLNIEDLEDFLQFTKGRGVDANKAVQRRGRGEKLTSIFKTEDQSLVNLNLDQYISYNRHDQALVEFGGEKASNPDPMLAIQRQYMQMSHRGAQTQYRMNHPTAWVKALERLAADGKLTSIDVPSGPMTDEMRVRHTKINGNSAEERALRQEQSVINRRLDMLDGSASELPTSAFTNTIDRGTDWAIEQVHNLGGSKVSGPARWVGDNIFKQASNKLLTLGFFQRMASLDQVLLQASHFIPITSVSPKNGLRGLQLAGVIRQAARQGDESTWKAVYDNLRFTVGLNEKEMKALMDHVMDSGRGYMRGAIAEDPNAGLTNSMLGRARDIVSTPYYAGENFSATMSRVTSFLDTKDNFPSLDVDSRAFWNAVTARDRDLSFALNKAQKSMVQSDAVTRVLTQWTSYPLRTIESIMVGGGKMKPAVREKLQRELLSSETSVARKTAIEKEFAKGGLSAAERGRLAAYTSMAWGIAGLGMYKTGAWVNEQMDNMMGKVIVDGVDVAFDSLLGVKVGDRLAFNPIQLWERAIGTVADPMETVPAFTLVGDTAAPVLSGLTNAFSGRWGLLSHDAATLARAWKIVDAGVMGTTMFLEDVRRSKGGQELAGDYTAVQSVLQAIGIKPSEATDFFRASEVTFGNKEKRDKAIKQAETPLRIAIEAAEEGNYSKALQYIKDADAIVQAYGFTETRLAEVREELFSRMGFERVNYTVMQLIKDGFLDQARDLAENSGE